jgi:hypothetical protein
LIGENNLTFHEFNAFYEKLGIEKQLIVINSPHQNDVVKEKKHNFR